MPGLLKQHTDASVGLGYGARRRWAAAELLEGFRCWRTNCFLHQLSTNGNLLQVENSNPMWRDCLSFALGQEPDASWSRQFALLQHLPRSLVRTACWRASYDWYLGALTVQRVLHQQASENGVLLPLLGSEWYLDYVRVLHETGMNLARLSWCYQPSNIELDKIEVD
jgi:hypothetical protein